MRSTMFLLTGSLCVACEPAPQAPPDPTWADVEPILRGSCNHCHGATATQTGSTIDGQSYRLDFFDMTAAVCGDAARALPSATLAAAWAPLIAAAITPPTSGGRARMPPAPADELRQWERETLLRWAMAPARGLPPARNARPDIHIRGGAAMVNQRLELDVVVDDADGEPVVGVLEVGPAVLTMDRPGSFHVDLDASTWPVGAQRARATLCDGWGSFSYELGTVTVSR